MGIHCNEYNVQVPTVTKTLAAITQYTAMWNRLDWDKRRKKSRKLILIKKWRKRYQISSAKRNYFRSVPYRWCSDCQYSSPSTSCSLRRGSWLAPPPVAFEKNSALFRDSRRGLGEFLQAGAIAEEEVENRMLAGVDNLNLVPVSFYPYMYAAPLRIGIGSHHNNHHRPIIPPKVLQDSEPRPYSSDGTSFAEEEEKINDEMHDRLEVPRGARHGSKRWRK